MNILVTSIGDAFAADIVIKRLQANKHRVVGCDCLPKEWIADAFNVDYFVQSPPAVEAAKYLDFIIRICRECEIKYIVPLSDLDIDAVIGAKERLKGLGICLCTPDIEVTRLCRDKFRLTQYLASHDICRTISTTLWSETDQVSLSYPILAKPRFGRASEGIIVVRSGRDLGYLQEAAANTDYILQPLIQGEILNVDVVRNPDNSVVCVARRDLIRHPSGVGTTVEIINHSALVNVCIRIAQLLNIIGATNFEFIETSDQLYLVEINPRFSGGVEFSYMAGYDVVTNHLRCFTGHTIEINPVIRRMIIARKYEEYITKELEKAEPTPG